LEQKWPVFLPYTQCNDSKETAHTWQDGEGFPWDWWVLEGGIMVTDGRDEECPCGTPRGILHEIWMVLTGSEGTSHMPVPFRFHVEKSCRLDNFESHGLEIMSEWTTKPMWKWNLEYFAQEASCSIGRWAGCHDDGIKQRTAA
jgi:hypothetical protein